MTVTLFVFSADQAEREFQSLISSGSASRAVAILSKHTSVVLAFGLVPDDPLHLRCLDVFLLLSSTTEISF